MNTKQKHAKLKFLCIKYEKTRHKDVQSEHKKLSHETRHVRKKTRSVNRRLRDQKKNQKKSKWKWRKWRKYFPFSQKHMIRKQTMFLKRKNKIPFPGIYNTKLTMHLKMLHKNEWWKCYTNESIDCSDKSGTQRICKHSDDKKI